MSDREKTAIDCIDRPALAGGRGRGRHHSGDGQPPFRLAEGGRLSRTDRFDALVRRFGWVMDHVKADMPPTSANGCSARRPRPPDMDGSRSRAQGAGRHRL